MKFIFVQNFKVFPKYFFFFVFLFITQKQIGIKKGYSINYKVSFTQKCFTFAGVFFKIEVFYYPSDRPPPKNDLCMKFIHSSLCSEFKISIPKKNVFFQALPKKLFIGPHKTICSGPHKTFSWRCAQYTPRSQDNKIRRKVNYVFDISTQLTAVYYSTQTIINVVFLLL